MKRHLRSILLVLAFLVGGVFHETLSQWNGWLPIGIALMLSISFIGVDVAKLRPHRLHLLIVFAIEVVGLGSFALARLSGHPVLAESLYYCGCAPVAAAAPVIVHLLRGKVEFITMAMLISHAVFAVLTPFVLPLVVHDPQLGYTEFMLLVAKQMASILAAPALISVVLRVIYPPCKAWSAKLGDVSLGIWIFNLTIISAGGIHRLLLLHVSVAEMLPMALGAVLICAFGFLAGYRLGYPEYKRECSQALGQKNTILTLYIASQPYASPLAYLGPVCYVFCHNIANAVQLSLAERERRATQGKEPATSGGDGAKAD